MQRVRGLVGLAALVGSVLVTGSPPASAYPGSPEPVPSDCTILGTDGSDILVGTAGPDVICGLGGDDQIDGKGGNDVLDGGDGSDQIHGRSGDDVVRAREGWVDEVDCGPGTDVSTSDTIDVVKHSCETRVELESVPSKMRAYGPGLESGVAGDQLWVDVETVNAFGQKIETSSRPLDVHVTGPKGEVLRTPIDDSGDAVIQFTYTPLRPGPHTVDITWGGVEIAGAPFTVLIDKHPDAVDASKSRAYGPGLEGGTAGQPTYFWVELNTPSGQRFLGGAKAAGLEVSAVGPTGKAVHLTQSVEQPGTVRFDYLPKTAGTYRISVTATGDDEPVPGNPFSVPIASPPP